MYSFTDLAWNVPGEGWHVPSSIPSPAGTSASGSSRAAPAATTNPTRVTRRVERRRRSRPSRLRQVAARAALTAALMAGGVLVGCDGEPEPGPAGGPEAIPAVSASTQDVGTAAQEAVTAYEGMWRSYAEAGATANPDHPGLARYADGVALTALVEGLRSYRSRGQILKGRLVWHPRVTDALNDERPTAVVLADCLDTTTFLVYSAGQPDTPIDADAGGRRAAKATVTQMDAKGWRVTTFGVQAVDTC